MTSLLAKEAMGIAKRSVTPDSPQSMIPLDPVSTPRLSTYQVIFSDLSVAPNDETALVVAKVSSHESGLCTTVVPFDSSPANRALCVHDLDGGAITSPDIFRDGDIDTFNGLTSTRLLSES